MATGWASAGGDGRASSPAESISSMLGISFVSRPVLRKLSRQPRLTSPTGSVADGRFPLLGFACNAERDRHDGAGLVDVGNVVDEGLRLAGVQEADGGRIASGKDGGFGEAVQAGRCLAEAAIRDVRDAPVAWVVSSPSPSNAVLLGQHFVGALSRGRPRCPAAVPRNAVAVPALQTACRTSCEQPSSARRGPARAWLGAAGGRPGRRPAGLRRTAAHQPRRPKREGSRPARPTKQRHGRRGRLVRASGRPVLLPGCECVHRSCPLRRMRRPERPAVLSR